MQPAEPVLPLDRRSVSWFVMGEPTAFLGAGRALLLQVAHPKVAAGVEQHSTYVTDPWARLFRTVDVMLKLAFGTPEQSAEQARVLERMHRRVVGTTDHGEAYDALDPELLLWVWATLCETALVVHELLFAPLSADERARYYDEWKVVAHGCGVPPGGCPETWDDFERYVERMVRHELRVTRDAVKVAHATSSVPLPTPLRQLASPVNDLATAALLPPAIRDAYGFRWDERRRRRFRRLLTLLRLQVRLVPRPVRELSTRYLVKRSGPLRFRPLQRHGAALTKRRMAELESTR